MTTTTINTTADQNLNLEFLPELLNAVEAQLIEPSWDGSAVLVGPLPSDLTVGIHDGAFHADEVLSLALLRLGQPGLQWIRTRDPEVLAGTIRVDVGEGLLDHHGQRYTPGVAACSRVYALLIQSEMIPDWAQRVLSPIVATVAAWDDGDDASPHPLPYVHALQAAATATGGDTNADFAAALDMVETHIRALLAAAAASAPATAIAMAEIEKQADATVPCFSAETRAADIRQLLFDAGHPAMFYVSPEADADWRVLCTSQREQYSRFKSAALLPERFRGLRGSELAAAAGLPSDSAIFCHIKGFIAGFTTREAALKFAALCAEEVK